jgi:hypothetical protein
VLSRERVLSRLSPARPMSVAGFRWCVVVSRFKIAGRRGYRAVKITGGRKEGYQPAHRLHIRRQPVRLKSKPMTGTWVTGVKAARRRLAVEGQNMSSARRLFTLRRKCGDGDFLSDICHLENWLNQVPVRKGCRGQHFAVLRTSIRTSSLNSLGTPTVMKVNRAVRSSLLSP